MRQYLVLRVDDKVRDVLRNFDTNKNGLVQILLDAVRSLGPPPDVGTFLNDKEITFTWAPPIDPAMVDDPALNRGLVVAYDFLDPRWIESLQRFLVEGGHLGELTGNDDSPIRHIGADPPIDLCSAHVPVASSRPFARRSRVREMLGIAELHRQGFTGRGVNVVIVDRGLNRRQIQAHRPGCWGGGLIETRGTEAGTAPSTSHGMMIARNVLDMAPEATLFDVPLIPERISRPSAFASHADAKVRALRTEISNRRQQSGSNTSWILVNAWGVFDRSAESPLGNYTQGNTHPLNITVANAISDNIDVVFGSGNCGLFTPFSRCGRLDRGPGRSIWGANAHPRVLTVGAVSANDDWLGYSSEGPAPWGGALKPDVCAPSQFCEDDNAATVNSGTSAACALVSGIIAAIRSKPGYGPDMLPPETLKAAINASARRREEGWNARTGHGIIDARALLERLDQSKAA